jgi:outer membrane protein OmpA-like peptidoglycan-associated protein
MEKHTDAFILLEGYTDSVGGMEYNLALSRRRAESIAFYLMNNFLVDTSRVVWNWYGPSDPVASNASSGGRAENRRVEIAVGGLN